MDHLVWHCQTAKMFVVDDLKLVWDTRDAKHYKGDNVQLAFKSRINKTRYLSV